MVRYLCHRFPTAIHGRRITHREKNEPSSRWTPRCVSLPAHLSLLLHSALWVDSPDDGISRKRLAAVPAIASDSRIVSEVSAGPMSEPEDAVFFAAFDMVDHGGVFAGQLTLLLRLQVRRHCTSTMRTASIA